MRKYEIVIQDDKGNILQTIPAKHKEHKVEVEGIEWKEVEAHPKYRRTGMRGIHND